MGGCRSPLPSLASPAQEGGAPPTLKGVLLLLCSRLPDGVTNPPHPTGASLQAACGPTAQPGGSAHGRPRLGAKSPVFSCPPLQWWPE